MANDPHGLELPEQVGLEFDSFLHLGRTHPDNPHEAFVMTPLGIKMSRAANGVSRRHGDVARQTIPVDRCQQHRLARSLFYYFVKVSKHSDTRNGLFIRRSTLFPLHRQVSIGKTNLVVTTCST